MSDPSTPDPAKGASRPTDVDAGESIQALDYVPAQILLHVSSDMERVHRLNACAKEPWTVRWLESFVERDDVLYDVGANIGAFSLIAATLGAKVMAFEPGFANYARLCKNIVLNGCEGRVVPVPFPLDAQTGLAGFKYRSLEPGQSRHRLSPDPWSAWGTGRQSRYQQPMCAMRLDDAIATFALPLPNHMKIDVDGSELRVLEGALGVLRSPTLKSLLVEIDGENWDQAMARLEGVGFVVGERVQRTAKGPSYALFTRDRAADGPGILAR